jgi:phosphate-selective porin
MTDRVVTAPGERRAAVINVIRRARRRIALSLFRCNDDGIVGELAGAVDRGVQVDVLVTGRAKGKKKLKRLWNMLETTGVTLHPYTDPVVKYHAKYLVVDDGPAVVASLNFTGKCFRNTVDAIVITRDPAVVDGLVRLHDADREGRSLPQGLPDRLIVGPERARQQFTSLIEGARTSIRLIDPKASDPVMTKLLEQRRQDGIEVEIHDQKTFDRLRSHGKLMLIDDRIAVVGSLAMAAMSLDFRREVALTIHQKPAVATIAHVFDSVAAAARTTVVAAALALGIGAPVHAQTPEPAPVRLVWNDRPSLRAGSWLRVDFLGKFQWDARRAGDEPVGFESSEIQRARVGVDGELFDHFQFNIEYELTDREIETRRLKDTWKDVYVDVNYTDAAQVRLGKFKVPFSREQLTSVASLDFIYRSLGASQLAPARDIGVMVHGDVGRVSYWTGVFRQDGENARSERILGADDTAAGRFVISPFQRQGESLLDQLELGVSGTISRLENASELPNGLRGRSLVSRYVFFEPLFVDGTRRRLGLDAEWRWDAFGARAEFMDVRDTRHGQGFLDNDLPAARARSWYVSGAWVLTGEEKNWPVNPRGELGRGGAGAVELVARYERLRFDGPGGEDEPFRHPRAETILPSGDRIGTVGVNWYANRWIKLQLHGAREQLEDPERHPRADARPFWNAVFRLQCAL